MDSDNLKAVEAVISNLLRLNPYYLGRTIGYLECLTEKNETDEQTLQPTEA